MNIPFILLNFLFELIGAINLNPNETSTHKSYTQFKSHQNTGEVITVVLCSVDDTIGCDSAHLNSITNQVNSMDVACNTDYNSSECKFEKVITLNTILFEFLVSIG